MHVTSITLALGLFLIAGCSDRIRSEDVSFDDPGLQQCWEDTLVSFRGKPYADEIEEMVCFEYGIRDLQGIEVLSGIKEVILRGNVEIANLQPLLSLSSLVWLDLVDCALQPDSTETLSKIETPIHLNISGNNVGDVSAYSRTINMVDFIAVDAGITGGVANLATLTNATLVSLGRNPMSPCFDIEALRATLPSNTTVSPSTSEIRPGIDCAP